MKRKKEISVGLMFLIGIVFLTILLIRASNWNLGVNEREIVIRFDYVGGLLKNAPVSMYGLEIGRVTSVDLMGDWVRVKARIDKKAVIRKGYKILIDTTGVVGEKQLEIINGPQESPEATEDVLIGINPTSIGSVLIKAGEVTDKAVQILDSIQRFVTANEREIETGISKIKDFARETKATLDVTTENINTLLSRLEEFSRSKNDDIEQIISDLKRLLAQLNKDRDRILPLLESVANNLDQTLSDSAPSLKRSIGDFDKITAQLLDSVNKINRTIDEINISLSKFTKNFQESANDANEKLQKSLEDLTRSGTQLTKTLDRIDSLVTQVEEGKGTLGRLIKEDSIYANLNETLFGSKKAIESLNTSAENIDRKIRSLANLDSNWIYSIRYSTLSNSLQGELSFNFATNEPYFYTLGLSVVKNNVTHNLQVGRNWGELRARIGSIRSKASVGFDYSLFSNRLLFSLDGINITSDSPKIDFSSAIRVRSFKNWYFTFGAENLMGSDKGFNLGFKGIY